MFGYSKFIEISLTSVNMSARNAKIIYLTYISGQLVVYGIFKGSISEYPVLVYNFRVFCLKSKALTSEMPLKWNFVLTFHTHHQIATSVFQEPAVSQQVRGAPTCPTQHLDLPCKANIHFRKKNPIRCLSHCCDQMPHKK